MALSVSAWTINHDKFEVMRLLGNAGVPASAVFDTQELSEDPSLNERGTFVTVDHPVRGPFKLPGFMVKMSDNDLTVKAAPLLGADNEQVYGDVLGISPERLAELKKQGVV